MTTLWKAVSGVVLVTAAVSAALYAVGERHEDKPVPVDAAADSQPLGIGALGRVEPASRVRRLSQPWTESATRLETLLVEEGEKVMKDQVLAEFSDAALKDLAVEQAEAVRTEAEANLMRTRAAGRASEVAAHRARIEALSADLEYAKRDAQRTAQLLPSGAGTIVAADQSRTAVARLTAAKKQAEAELESLIQPRSEDIALAEARVQAAEAAVKRARAESELARLRAPLDGTVLRIFTWPGEKASDEGIMELADVSKLDVVAEVYETDVPRLRIGADAEVIVPGDDRRYKAKVYDVGRTVRRSMQASTDPVAAVDSRTVEVRLSLGPDATEALSGRSNMQVQVAIWP